LRFRRRLGGRQGVHAAAAGGARGAGAATSGGRLNRPGVEAFYASFSPQTALAEYQQDADLLPPGTIAAFHLRLASVVDFSEGFVAGQWDPIWADLHCNWRNLAFRQRIEPPSWTISDLVREAGHSAIIFPSQRAAGQASVVIVPQHLRPDDALYVHDPDQRAAQQACLASIQRTNRPLYRAYLLKEQLREIVRSGGSAARAMLRRWISWALRSRLEPFSAGGGPIVRRPAGAPGQGAGVSNCPPRVSLIRKRRSATPALPALSVTVAVNVTYS
jgi:RES domain-containing protein